MPGRGSTISIDGARSETLAEYLFAAWGMALRGRTDSDYGIDLFCALAETIGRRAWVRAQYTVQVKSNHDGWGFTSAEEVRWLIEHPTPLFLCVVEKAVGRLRIYHTFARFDLWAQGQLPARIRLVPGDGAAGEYRSWLSGETFDLGAPIIEITSSDLFNNDVLDERRRVLEAWIQEEHWNLHLMRSGLRRLRAPHIYTTNSGHFGTFIGLGLQRPSDEQFAPGVIALREQLDCIGSQLFARGGSDVHGAVIAGLIFRWLERRFPSVFLGDRLLEGPRAMSPLFLALAELVDGKKYVCGGIDELQTAIESHSLIRRILGT